MSTAEHDGVRRPRATMNDVAALAGVSLKSVSRVVNAEPGVSASLRDRVVRAVEQLDYRHNLAASNLRRAGQRTGMIAALLQDLGNSFSSGLLRAIEGVADERGSAVLAASLDEQADRERQRVADLVSRRVDGLVLMPATADQSYLMSERRAGLPMVFVDRLPTGIDADSVTVDNYAGARDAVEHLLRHGHRRIAMLADLPFIQTATQRIRGYEDALRDAGIAADPVVMATSVRGSDASAQVVAGMLGSADPPTAVFATRNVISVGVVRRLRESGLAHRVAVVGFDDLADADLFDPPLTVIRQNVETIGAEVARTLFARLDGDTSPTRHVVVQHTLVTRGSGEIPPPQAYGEAGARPT